MNAPASPSPRWFAEAIASRPQRKRVEADGTAISYRAWGPPQRPGLVLIHGGAAHSGWWDHIAPLLTSHRVVAPDLSGHGDSGRRPEYSMDLWAREVAAVCRAEQLARPVVVGHSMGGWVAVNVGGMFADLISAVAVLDSPLNDQPPEEETLRQRQRPTRIYPTAEDAWQRFATIPSQDVVLPYVRDHVVRESVRQVEGGWTWKFDPVFFGHRTLLRDLLPDLRCPAALFRCEYGLVTEEMVTNMEKLVSEDFAVVDVPASGHHPMLDQPLALVTALRTLLTFWPKLDHG